MDSMKVKTKNIFIIHKADQLTSTESVDSMTLGVAIDLPKKIPSLDDARELYNVDAKIIFDVLKNSVPQGTRHRLMQLLLLDVENLYRGL